MGAVVLTTENIDRVVRSLRRQQKKGFPYKPRADFLILPRSERILSKRYRGIGRPRKIDYDNKTIEWSKITKSAFSK